PLVGEPPDHYVVEPGLLAGAHPAAGGRNAAGGIAALRTGGVTAFVDLTAPGELPPYDEHAAPAQRHARPGGDFGVPTDDELRAPGPTAGPRPGSGSPSPATRASAAPAPSSPAGSSSRAPRRTKRLPASPACAPHAVPPDGTRRRPRSSARWSPAGRGRRPSG